MFQTKVVQSQHTFHGQYLFFFNHACMR